MEAHSFSSLKDMLKCPSNQKPNFMEPLSSPSSPRTHTESLEPSEDPNLTKMFDKLVLEESHFLSSTQSPPPRPPPLSSSLIPLSSKTETLNDTTVDMQKNGSKKPWTIKGLIPPPISCLKLIKKGKPYFYVKADEGDGRFVVEEIRIPPGDFLRASRENGRLRLYFAQSDEQSLEEEEEEEEEEKEEEDYEMISHDEVEGI